MLISVLVGDSTRGKSYWSTFRKLIDQPIAADWGGGMSACCKLRFQFFADAGIGQWMTA